MAFTSQLGTADSNLTGATLVFALGGGVGTEYVLTATSTVTFSQVAHPAALIDLTASHAITFSQVAHPSLIRLTASNSFTIVQDMAAPGLLTRTGSTTIAFSDTAHNSVILSLTASSAVAFTQGAAPGLLTRTGFTDVVFDQRTRAGVGLADAISLTGSTTITFSQSASRSLVLAAAIQLDGSTTLTFAQSAIFPIELTAASSVTFSGLAEFSRTSASNTITFSQSAVVNRDWTLTASTTVTFGQSFIYSQLRDGEEVGRTCSIIREYSPLIGSGDPSNPTPPRLVAPPVTRFNDVVFFYPALSQCGATNSLTLRTPNFGDRDRQAYDIINRESRGGTLQIYRDPTWPDQRTLSIDISGLKEVEGEDMLLFLATTVGREVGFRDWNGRTWKGIIQNPDTPIIRTRADQIDVAIEIEVTSQVLELSVCTSVTFAQTADVVLVPV